MDSLMFYGQKYAYYNTSFFKRWGMASNATTKLSSGVLLKLKPPCLICPMMLFWSFKPQKVQLRICKD